MSENERPKDVVDDNERLLVLRELVTCLRMACVHENDDDEEQTWETGLLSVVGQLYSSSPKSSSSSSSRSSHIIHQR